MLQSFSSQHALCHFVNLNRISRTDKRASMQLGASSLCPTPPPSHSCWLSLGLKGGGGGLSSSSGNCLRLRLSRKATLSSVPFEFIVLTNGWHTDRGRHSPHSQYSQRHSRMWMRIHLPSIHHEYFLSISLFFSQVSHFLRVPQTLRQLIINAASWQH